MLITKIHYIWMGSLLPEKYYSAFSYILSHSQHTVYFWTDRPVENREHFLAFMGYTSVKFTTALNRLRFVDIRELEKACENKSCVLSLDNNEHKTLMDCFVLENRNYSERYKANYNLEIINKVGNLATLSDVLRLVILYLEGGLYIDCDNTFTGQSLKDFYNRRNFRIILTNSNSLYSRAQYFGNSVLACHSKAVGCLTLLKRTLNNIYKQKNRTELIDDLGSFKKYWFSENSYLKHLFEKSMLNKYIKFDADLRRHGKDPNGYKLRYLEKHGGVRCDFIHQCYPYACLAIEIGPGTLQQFETIKSNYSKRFPSKSSLLDIIECNSDQAWL